MPSNITISTSELSVLALIPDARMYTMLPLDRHLAKATNALVRGYEPRAVIDSALDTLAQESSQNRAKTLTEDAFRLATTAIAVGLVAATPGLNFLGGAAALTSGIAAVQSLSLLRKKKLTGATYFGFGRTLSVDGILGGFDAQARQLDALDALGTSNAFRVEDAFAYLDLPCKSLAGLYLERGNDLVAALEGISPDLRASAFQVVFRREIARQEAALRAKARASLDALVERPEAPQTSQTAMTGYTVTQRSEPVETTAISQVAAPSIDVTETVSPVTKHVQAPKNFAASVAPSFGLYDVLADNPFLCYFILAGQRTGKTSSLAAASYSAKVAGGTEVYYLNLFDHGQGNDVAFAHAEGLVIGDLNNDDLSRSDRHALIQGAIDMIKRFHRSNNAILVVDEWASLGNSMRSDLDGLWECLAPKAEALTSNGLGCGRAVWAAAPKMVAGDLRPAAKLVKGFKLAIVAIAPEQVVEWVNPRNQHVSKLAFDGSVITNAISNWPGAPIQAPPTHQVDEWISKGQTRIWWWEGKWSNLDPAPAVPQPARIPDSMPYMGAQTAPAGRTTDVRPDRSSAYTQGSTSRTPVGPATRFGAVDVKAPRLSEARDLGFDKVLSYAMDVLESKPGEHVRLTELIPGKQSRSTYRDRLFAHWATNPYVEVTHERQGNSPIVTTWVVLMTEDEGDDDEGDDD